MTDAQIGFLAAGAALLGAVIGAMSAFGVELYRSRALRRKEAAERLLEGLTAYAHTIEEWALMTQQCIRCEPGSDAFDKFWNLSEDWGGRAREASTRLFLLAPPKVLKWLDDVYEPATRDFRAVSNAALSVPGLQSITRVQEEFDRIQNLWEDGRPMLREEIRRFRS
jgi:hypothetical protein